jgi:MoxR-like ATPases
VNLVNTVLNRDDIVKMQSLVKSVRVDDSITRYIVRLVRGTRSMRDVKIGASPRAAQTLGKLVRAWALINGRDYVIPDDVKQLAPYVLNHRIIVTNDDPLRVINEILEKTPTPMMAKILGMGYSNE